jgi:hypothetical protein
MIDKAAIAATRNIASPCRFDRFRSRQLQFVALVAISSLFSPGLRSVEPDKPIEKFRDYRIAFRFDDTRAIYYHPVQLLKADCPECFIKGKVDPYLRNTLHDSGFPSCPKGIQGRSLPAELLHLNALCPAPDKVTLRYIDQVKDAQIGSRWRLQLGGDIIVRATLEAHRMESDDKDGLCSSIFYPLLRIDPEDQARYAATREKYYLAVPETAALSTGHAAASPDWIRDYPPLTTAQSKTLKSLLRIKMTAHIKALLKDVKSSGLTDSEADLFSKVSAKNSDYKSEIIVDLQAMRLSPDQKPRLWIRGIWNGSQILMKNEQKLTWISQVLVMGGWTKLTDDGAFEAFSGEHYFSPSSMHDPIGRITSAGRLLNLFDLDGDGYAEAIFEYDGDYNNYFSLVEADDESVHETGVVVRLSGCTC